MRSILIVDDEEYIREDLTTELQSEFQIHTAASVSEALRIVKKEDLDCAVIDLKLDYTSEVGGVEIFNVLKKKTSNTKIVIISGFPFDKIKDKLFSGVDIEYRDQLDESNYVYKGGKGNYIDTILEKLAGLVAMRKNIYE